MIESPQNPQNPYYDTTTIRSAEMFFGRTYLLKRIYSALMHKQCVSLVGLRSMGKSSVLNHIRLPEIQQQFECDFDRYIFVLLDLRAYRHKTCEDFFAEVSKKIIQQSHGRLELDLQDLQGEDAFSAILDQAQEQGFYPVLLMDAFDNVTHNSNFDLEFFSFLRSQATMGRVSYVTATNAPLYKVCHSSIEESPFFNIFIIYTLDPLLLEEAQALIMAPAQKAGMPFSNAEVNCILALAGRHPFFIQRICSVLFEEKCLQGGAEIAAQRLRELAYHELQPYFIGIWDRLVAEQQEILRDEVRFTGISERKLPQLSESALFGEFVLEKFNLQIFDLNTEELEYALEKLNNSHLLGESSLRHLKSVSARINHTTASVTEKGMMVRMILNEAFERLHGNGLRRDAAPDWKLYNILYYRYFKYHLKNNLIVKRLEFTSTRQYFRERNKAIEALLNVLLEMEKIVA